MKIWKLIFDFEEVDFQVPRVSFQGGPGYHIIFLPLKNPWWILIEEALFHLLANGNLERFLGSIVFGRFF